MMFEPGQECRTRGGHRVRIYANDAGGKYPVHGAVYIDGEWLPKSWTANGRYDGSDRLSNMDIHVVRPRITATVWINAHYDDDGNYYFRAYSTEETAAVDGRGRRACQKFTFDCEEGEGL